MSATTVTEYQTWMEAEEAAKPLVMKVVGQYERGLVTGEELAMEVLEIWNDAHAGLTRPVPPFVG